MKYLIVLVTLITTLNINAQSKNHFLLHEGKVSWVKVYETKKSKEEIISLFKNTGLFKLVKIEDNKIIATLKPQTIDKSNKKIAGSLPPPLVVKPSFAGNVIIGLKDGKYRVSCKDIILIGSGELIKKKEKQPFEKHYVNKDGKSFRISFNKKPSTIYNLKFNQMFQVETVTSDDW